MLKFLVVYSFVKLFVMCEFMDAEDDRMNLVTDPVDDENLVLDSVYDTMRHNYEIKLRQNLEKLNLISDIRNKRNINEPMSMTPMNPNLNSIDFYKNHQYEVNRKNPVNFPLGFKSPPRLPLANGLSPVSRSDYEYEEWVITCCLHLCNWTCGMSSSSLIAFSVSCLHPDITNALKKQLSKHFKYQTKSIPKTHTT